MDADIKLEQDEVIIEGSSLKLHGRVEVVDHELFLGNENVLGELRELDIRMQLVEDKVDWVMEQWSLLWDLVNPPGEIKPEYRPPIIR